MRPNHRPLCVIAAAAVVLGAAVAARADADQLVTSRIESVDLFKNGMAVVHRTVELSGPGVHQLEDVPSPVHGTFSIASERPVSVRLTHRTMDVPVGREPVADLGSDLAGRAVTIHFRDGVPSVTGRVVQMKDERPPDDAPRAARPSRFIVLRTAEGHTYADQSLIAHVTVNDGGGTVRKRTPVLTFQADLADDQPMTVGVSYLTQGLAWAPEYRIDLSDSETLHITQSAMIRNELTDLVHADVRLITGFPAVRFGHVRSLLSEDTTMRAFFAQLAQDAAQRRGHSAVVMQQRIAPQSPDADGFDIPVLPGGEGPDVYYHEVGKRDVARGETLGLTVATEEAQYQRIVEWIVPDNRDESGRRTQDAEHGRGDEAWDALRFTNPFSFPMTTAPATVAGDGRIFGQQLSYWVNPGERTTLRINRALSLRTRAFEEERSDGERELVRIHGRNYRQVPVRGEVSATNHRDEALELVVRRRFSGDMVSAEGQPAHSLREEGAYSLNRRNELTWTATLEPGETWTREYRYDALVLN